MKFSVHLRKDATTAVACTALTAATFLAAGGLSAYALSSAESGRYGTDCGKAWSYLGQTLQGALHETTPRSDTMRQLKDRMLMELAVEPRDFLVLVRPLRALGERTAEVVQSITRMPVIERESFGKDLQDLGRLLLPLSAKMSEISIGDGLFNPAGHQPRQCAERLVEFGVAIERGKEFEITEAWHGLTPSLGLSVVK